MIKNSGDQNLVINQLYTVTPYFSYNTWITTKDSSFGFVMRDIFTQIPDSLNLKLAPNDSVKVTLTITDLCNICKRSSIKLQFTDTLIIRSNSLTMDSIRIFMEGDGTMSSVDDNKNLPIEYELYQNYPNPFNPATNIGFRIPNFGFVSLKVYDLLGREVATLVNEYKTAGSYNVTFNADKLASGVYIYQIQAGNFVSNKKLVLLK